MVFIQKEKCNRLLVHLFPGRWHLLQAHLNCLVDGNINYLFNENVGRKILASFVKELVSVQISLRQK